MITIVDDIIDCLNLSERENLPIVLWGVGSWGRLFYYSKMYRIDDICDSDPCQREKFATDNNIKILSPTEIESKYKGKLFIIINSFGYTRRLQEELFTELCCLKISAKLVSLHTNIGFDLYSKDFVFKGKRLLLFEHLYNCGFNTQRMSERCIEIAIMQEWLKAKKNVVEIGAVSPYYFPGYIEEIVDPADRHVLVTERKSVFDVDLRGKNVLCISTVEHIGTGQYGVSEKRDAVMAIRKILDESAHCLITTPIGENPLIDEYLRDNYLDENTFVYYRNFVGNKWEKWDTGDDVQSLINYCRRVREVYVSRDLLGANCAIMIIIR